MGDTAHVRRGQEEASGMCAGDQMHRKGRVVWIGIWVAILFVMMDGGVQAAIGPAEDIHELSALQPTRAPSAAAPKSDPSWKRMSVEDKQMSKIQAEKSY